jgi:hypothetical protein
LNTPEFFPVNSADGGIIHHPFSSQNLRFIIIADPIENLNQMNHPISNRCLHLHENAFTSNFTLSPNINIKSDTERFKDFVFKNKIKDNQLHISTSQDIYDLNIFALNKIPLIFTRTDPFHHLDLPKGFKHILLSEISSTNHLKELCQKSIGIAISCYGSTYQSGIHQLLIDIINKVGVKGIIIYHLNSNQIPYYLSTKYSNDETNIFQCVAILVVFLFGLMTIICNPNTP